MLKKNIFISLLIVLFGLLATWQIMGSKTTQAAPDGHETAEAEAPATPRGPHQGRMFTDQDLTLEVQIYETDIPPEFHIWFWRDGKPVPVQEVKFSTRVYRLGKTDTITYRQEKDYLLSEQTIYEPHSFKVVFEGIYQNRRYKWQFVQEEGRLEIPPELVKRSEIQVLKAGPQVLGTKRRFPGQIALDQDKYVHLVPPVSGRVIEVYKHVGEKVRQGEVLAVIHSRELADLRLQRQLLNQKKQAENRLLQREELLSSNTHQLLQLLRQGQDPEQIHRQMLKSPLGEHKATLLTAFAELRSARQSLSREHQLRADTLSSQEALQIAQKDYENALSRYIATFEEVIWQRENSLQLKRQDLRAVQTERQALEQKLQVLQVPTGGQGLSQARFELRSPISGIITEKHVAIGESVGNTQALFVVADLSIVWAEILVPDAQLENIQFGQKVKILSQHKQREAFGTISHISPVVDTHTRRAESHAHIANPDGYWRPGMFVDVEVTTNVRQVPVAVAKSALQSYNDWTVVYGKFGDFFEIRPLELGQEDDEWVEVKAGIAAGQPYAAQNSFIIKAEIGKKAATHDH